jgi:carnitine 3-dehydrogenase
VHVRKEIEAFVGDRMLEALWREALWLVNDDIATAEEIDDVIRYSFGLRWAQMGTFMVYRLAGGEAGMRHFMAQFGPALKWPWTKLMDVPELTEELIDKIAAQSDMQAGDYSIRELERIRDDNLIAIMQALKIQNDGKGWGAGAVLKSYEEKLYRLAQTDAARQTHDLSQPLRLIETAVQPDWVDYNGHMSESRFLQVFGDASDVLFRIIGVDDAYRARGLSYYTVETHMLNLKEVAGLEPVYVTTRILDADEKRLHLFHSLHHGRSDEVLASGEQMLLHVDTAAQRACQAAPDVLAKVEEIKAAQAALPRPAQAGRAIGIRRAA